MYFNEEDYYEDLYGDDRPSSLAELDRADAYERGFHRQDRQWIVSDRDCLYRNPYYVGPNQAHPDGPYDVDETQEEYEARLARRPAARVVPDYNDDDIPF